MTCKVSLYNSSFNKYYRNDFAHGAFSTVAFPLTIPCVDGAKIEFPELSRSRPCQLDWLPTFEILEARVRITLTPLDVRTYELL